MRRRLFAAVSLTALLSAPAFAQDATIDDERTEPVDTATADNGNPGNLVIGANGRVRLTNVQGPAVTINSDNTLTTDTAASIEIVDQDADGNDVRLTDATGVHVFPGVTTDIQHSGAVRLNDTYVPVASDTDTDLVDTDGDGEPDSPDTEVDGAFADDLRKIGILVGELDGNFDPVTGQAGVTGSLTLTSSSGISVEGQESYGLRVATGISGDVLAQGSISVVGENSRGLSIEANIGGDVEIDRVNTVSPGGNAVAVEGDVDGGLRFTGAINLSGYRTSRRSVQSVMELFDDGDDNLDSGSAVIVAGNVIDGIFIAGTAEIQQFSGNGAAFEIAGAGNTTLNIGTATTPDDFDVLNADNQDEDDLPEAYDHAVVNRGNVVASGVFDGKATTAFLIAGRDGNGDIRAVILAGEGLRNEGTISATSFDAEAVGLRMGAGADADTISNSGLIQAQGLVGYDGDGFADLERGTASAYALVLDQGSAIRRILNDQGQIIASVQDGVASGSAGATAVLLNTNSLEQLDNQGNIIARSVSPGPDDLEANNVDLIAIDARNHDGGLTVTQSQALDENSEPTDTTPSINGDILFGDGDDTLELLAGTVTGDVSFGLGNDQLIINGAELNGSLSNGDANLTIDVTNGRIILSGNDSVDITQATFNDGGVLEIRIDTSDRTGAFIDATGDVTFANGSDLSVSLGGLIEDVQDFTLVSAGSLNIADTAILDATDAPFLYNAAIRTADNDANTLVLSLSRKTSDELGMNANEAAAYDEAFAAMTAINELGNAFAAIRTADDFFGAYNQLLPEYQASAIQFALANNDAAAGALASRLMNARQSPDALAGIWVQEFGYFADRNATAFGPGYRGQGVGVAMGIDRPMGPFYAVGVHLVGAASEVEEIDGFDEPMVALSGQIGGYAALDVGGFDVSGSVGLGYDYFETERSILIDSFSTTNTADWSGWHVAAALQAGRDFQMGSWVIRPEANLTYLSLFESGYTEQNEDEALSALALIVDDRESSVMTGGATVSVARRFGTDISWWQPSIRVGYRGELLNDSMDTVAQFGESGSPFTLRSQALPGSGILAGVGLSAGSQYTTFTFAYDADVRDQFIRHVARLVVRLTF
jgi:uncharacterized protein with beta-barrel porin domain